MTRKSINAAVSALALAAVASGPALAADPGATGDTIRIAMLEWTGAQITSQLAGRVLEKAGFLYTGEVRRGFSRARSAEAETRRMVWLA